MTYLEIDKAIIDITQKICDECKARLAAIPMENSTERKAVQIEYGIYTFCGNAGALFNTDPGREKVLRGRQYFLWMRELPRWQKYQKTQNIFRELDDTEKLCLTAALQAELFVRLHWLERQYADLSAAKASGDTDNIFKLTIKIGAVKNMFAAWEAWRIENNVYPHMFEGECK